MPGDGKNLCVADCKRTKYLVPADSSLLPQSQNKSIFTSAVWLGPIHRRINRQEETVVVTDSTEQRRERVIKREDAGKYCISRGNLRGTTLSWHKSKWTMRPHSNMCVISELLYCTCLLLAARFYLKKRRQRDCSKPPSAPRNQILHIRSRTGRFGKVGIQVQHAQI